MIRMLWYYFVKYYMLIGHIFYYKKILVTHVERIPKNESVIFVANHQNALIDPLVIGSYTPKVLYFLTRSGVFANSFVKKILYSINMLPVYRIRDGYETLNKNEIVFQKCYQVLNENKAVLIFPEGSHNIRRKVRPLSKGFIRIAFGALEKYPEMELVVVPVGLNYTDSSGYAGKLNIVYGQPVDVNYFKENFDKVEARNKLKQSVSDELKTLITHVEDSKNYENIVSHFEKDDFLYPEKVNKKLASLPRDVSSAKKEKKKKGFNLLELLVRINSFFPMLLWKKIKPGIKEKEFTSTFRFSVGIIAFPFFYLIQSLILCTVFNKTVGYTYFVISFLLVLLLTKTRKS